MPHGYWNYWYNESASTRAWLRDYEKLSHIPQENVMSRKPNTPPATIYDYRRCQALCDVLALEDIVTRNRGLIALAQGWGIELRPDKPGMLVARLAQHALAHGRGEGG